MKHFCWKCFRPQGKISDIKWEKSQSIGHFAFFSTFIELVRELVINTMHNKFEENTRKTVVIVPTS